MAFPSSFPESNCILETPPGISPDVVSSISVLRGIDTEGTPIIISCWKLTQMELDEINRTGRIWVGVMGGGMQPMWVVGRKPIQGVETFEAGELGPGDSPR